MAIAERLRDSVDDLTMVYSDPDESISFQDIRAIRRPNNLFFADKFQTCLAHCKSDILLMVHADCFCESWSGLVESCLSAFDSFDSVSLWAPNIDNTPFNIANAELVQIDGSNLSVVAQTDGLVLAFDHAARERLKRCSFEGNIYGWGIDWMMICNAYASGRIAVVDRSINVHHRAGTGYSGVAAKQQMLTFLEQMTIDEKAIYAAFRSYLYNKKGLKRKRKFSMENILTKLRLS
jgi:hypothetical protein